MPNISLDELSQSRSRLRHSWLENEVLNKDADQISDLLDAGGWPMLQGQFEERIAHCYELADRLQEVYDPSLRVDTSRAFAGLSPEFRDAIRKAQAKAYAAEAVAKLIELQEPLRDATKNVETAFGRFLALFSSTEARAKKVEVKVAWDNLLRQAQDLHAILGMLPREVIRPSRHLES